VDAMRLGATAVLVNSAILTSADPVKMADAFKVALKKGQWRGVA